MDNSGKTIDIKDIEVGKILHATEDVTCGSTLSDPLHKLSTKIDKSIFQTISVSEAKESDFGFVYRDEQNYIKVVDKNETEVSYVWKAIESLEELVSGEEYLIVCETKGKSFDASMEDITGSVNASDVSITDKTIPYDDTTKEMSFIITKGTDGYYTIKSKKNSYYIGQIAKNKVTQIDELPEEETELKKYQHTITFDGSLLKITTLNSSFSSFYLQYNASANKFAYYSSTQVSAMIYKKGEIEGKTTYTWRTLVKNGDIESITDEWLEQNLVPINN